MIPYTHCDMNKFIPLNLIFVISLILTTGIQAQDQRTLTLEESIEIAKDSSPLARAANFELVSAKWRYKSFRADLLPSLSLGGDAPNYNKSIFSNIQDDGSVTFSSRTQSEA